VLSVLWKAQPDAAAQEPFPYTGTQQLRQLLCADPFFDIRREAGGQAWVKLRLSKIKEVLNF
jgi:hypothetical protein